MHGIVCNLEKRCLIQRKDDASGGRILCTELTPVGYEVVAEAHEVIRQVEDIMLVNISGEHKILLKKLLTECFNNLN